MKTKVDERGFLMKTAVYPGSFDPVTNGHLDVIERTAKIFDKVYVAILKNDSKSPLFSVEERIELIKRVTNHINNIEIISFDGLLVDFVKVTGSNVIIKGLRAMSDFEYEFQMALTNKKLEPNIETLFLTTSANNQFLSSSIVKEVAKYHAKLDGLVPEQIQQDIYNKIKEKNNS